MKFVEVNELPEMSTHRGIKFSLRDRLDEFMTQNIKIARVEEIEGVYTNVRNCQISVKNTIRNYGMPIDAVVRNGVLYLVRRDI